MEIDQTLVDDVKEMVMHGESREDVLQQLIRGENLSIDEAEQYYELASQAVDNDKSVAKVNPSFVKGGM